MVFRDNPLRLRQLLRYFEARLTKKKYEAQKGGQQDEYVFENTGESVTRLCQMFKMDASWNFVAQLNDLTPETAPPFVDIYTNELEIKKMERADRMTTEVTMEE